MGLSRFCAYLLLAAVLTRLFVSFPEDPQIQPISHALFLLVAPMLVLMAGTSPRREPYKLGLAALSLAGSVWAGLHLLFGDPHVLASWSCSSSYATYPGSPSWGTVLGLIGLSASGLIYHDSPWRYLSGGLSGLIGLVGLIGHLFAYPPPYYTSSFSSGMALSTALFLVLGSITVITLTLHWRKRAGQQSSPVVF